MRLIVFGATGPTGRHIVRQALDQGHSVTAFARDPAKLEMRHDNLRVERGDMLDAESVDRVLSEPADAVISALGVYHRKPSTALSDGTANILAAMQKHGPRRLAVVSSLGVGDSAEQGNFVARQFQKIFLKQVLADKERQEQHIRDSGLDWTIVRPPQLIDAERINEDVVVWQGPAPTGVRLTWKTPRATVAHFVLAAVVNGTHVGQAVNISESR